MFSDSLVLEMGYSYSRSRVIIVTKLLEPTFGGLLYGAEKSLMSKLILEKTYYSK